MRINRPFGRAYVPLEHDSLGSCKFVRFAYAILETLSCPSSTAHSASFGCASASPYSRPTGTSRSAEVRRAAVRLIAWKSLIWCFFERALAMGRWSKIRRNPFLRTLFVHVRAIARTHFPHRTGTSMPDVKSLFRGTCAGVGCGAANDPSDFSHRMPLAGKYY